MKKKINRLTSWMFLLAMLSACSSNNNRSDAYGNFEAVDIIVSAQGKGQIIDFNLEEGMQLQAGKKVGLIDTSMLHLQKMQLESKIKAVASKMENIRAQVEVQKQQLQNLITDQERIEKLFLDGAATKKQLDDINGAAELTRKQITATRSQQQNVSDEVEALKAQIDQINRSIADCSVINPVQGTVLSKFAEKGEVTGFGKPLYKIANLESLNLKVYVSGALLPEIELGQEVEVLVDKNAEENTRLQGEITWISDQAEFTPKTIQTKEERVKLVYAVKIRVNNKGSLKIGMPGEINFTNN